MGDGRPMIGSFWETLGARGTRTGFLQRTWVGDAGRVYAEVYTVDGRIYPQVPVMTRGGAAKAYAWEPMPTVSRDRSSRTEDEDAAQVYLLSRQGQQPCVAGAVQHPKQAIAAETPDVDQGSDHPGTVGLGDFAWVLNEGRVILDARGGFTVVTDGTTLGDDARPNARVQLPSNGVLRVSRGGSADERLVLSGPLVDYLGTLATRVNELSTTVNALLAALKAATGNVVPVVPDPTLSSVEDPVTAELQAAAIHVSSDAEGSP